MESSIDCRADWFEHCFEDARESVELRLPEKGKEKAHVVRFEIAKRKLFCQLGDWVVAKLPVRVARLGYAADVPDEESAYDRMLAPLLARKVDAICLDAVRPETVLWSYLQESPLVQKYFRFYSPMGPLPHRLIRITGLFSDYLRRFSPKTRKNRLREIKILRELGNVKLTRVVEGAGIDSFLKAAYGISRKTHQYKRFGWSVAARDPRLVKNEMQRLAQHGWLRSYLLTCGNVPCSFILGQQTGSRFRPVAAGVDPAWRNYSVGTVLLLLVLEDLFKENPPEFYDLGVSTKQKDYLATDSYLEASVWLFRRRPYATLASNIYRVWNLTSSFGGATLERFGLKEKVGQWMRQMEQATSKTAMATAPKRLSGSASGSAA